MNNIAFKNIIYSIVLMLMIFLVYLYRQSRSEPVQQEEVEHRVVVTGQTMGTTYRIVYLDEQLRDFKEGVDSVLWIYNQSLSTYIPDSELSRFNHSDTLVFSLPYFYPVLSKSEEVFRLTGGAFDPTVGTLVNAWGFGPDGPALKDSLNIHSLLRSVGFDKVVFDEHQVIKKVPGVYLDFSAIAKGYGVDVVAEYLQEKGVEDFLVEIGGELSAKGVNDKGELWKVGVSTPNEDTPASELYGIIALDSSALATSGNYRNFYVEDGKKYAHTIDPATGYPVQHELLSVTVVARDCMTADAYATAMMVMGTEKSIDLQRKIEGLEVFLIYTDEEGKMTSYTSDGLKPYLSFPQK